MDSLLKKHPEMLSLQERARLRRLPGVLTIAEIAKLWASGDVEQISRICEILRAAVKRGKLIGEGDPDSNVSQCDPEGKMTKFSPVKLTFPMPEEPLWDNFPPGTFFDAPQVEIARKDFRAWLVAVGEWPLPKDCWLARWWSGEKCQDGQHYIRQWSVNRPNYIYWLRFSLWPLINAACLVCGIDPNKISEEEKGRRRKCEDDPLNFAFHGAVSAMKAGELEHVNTEVRPSDYIRWYHSKGFDIPPELEPLLQVKKTDLRSDKQHSEFRSDERENLLDDAFELDETEHGYERETHPWDLIGMSENIVRSYIHNGQTEELHYEYNLTIDEARFALKCVELATLPIWDAEALADALTLEEYEGYLSAWGRQNKESVLRYIKLAQAAGLLPLNFHAKQGLDWALKHHNWHVHNTLIKTLEHLNDRYFWENHPDFLKEHLNDSDFMKDHPEFLEYLSEGSDDKHQDNQQFRNGPRKRRDRLTIAIEEALKSLRHKMNRDPTASEVFKYLGEYDETGCVVEMESDKLVWEDTNRNLHDCSPKSLANRLSRIRKSPVNPR